jgi:ATP-binding cassette subfamily C protein CydCD
MNLDSRLLRRLGESRLALMMTIVLGTAAGVFTVMQAGYLSQVITRVFLGNQSLEQVVSTLVVLLGVIITRSVLAWVSEIWANSIAVRIKTQLRVELFERLLKLGPGYARGERTGELTNVLVEGVEALDIYYSQYLPQLVLAALVPLVYLFFVLRVDLLSGVILLLTAPLIPMFMVLIGNMAQAQTRKQWKALSRMSAYFLDVLQGLTTLKRLGRSRAQVKVIAQVSDGYCSTTMSVLRITFLSALVLEMVATLSTAVVAVEIGLRLLYGRLVFEEALFVLLLAPEFYLPLRLLGTRFHAGMAGVAAAKRIFEILETPADTGVEGQTENKKRRKTEDGSSQEFDERRGEQSFADQPEVMGDLRFDEVHYKYGDERAALNGVAFTIDVGQKVALVGPSGAGKSTIAGLLLHFFYPSEGKILVGGKSLTSIDAVEWRTQVAWISQDPTLFYGTLVDNIRLARPDASMKDIVQAAKQAQAHEFIENQPLGYDTVIGERGARLSAGQVQRIALARAFLKDAPLLILDEPTVNLDPETEASLQSAMDELLVGRTALIIAHRLNTTINADKILVLDGGQIVEQGSHSELSRQGGLYSRLIASAGEPAAGSDSHSTKRAAPADVERETVAALEPRAARAAFRPPIQPPANSLYPVYSSPSFLRASRFSTFRRLVSLVNPFKGQVALSVLLGFCTVVCGIGLLGTSAYLISAAALQPSIAELQVAIVGVRFFGISRGLFRYLERLVSHQVTFRLLANLRVWFYRALEPLAPARLMSYRSGDLLSRIQDDTESLQNFYVRVLAPPLVAILVALVMGLFLSHFDRSLAMVLLIFFLLVGVGLPLFIQTISRTSGRRVVMLRGALNAALVEGVQGMGDLLVYGQEARRIGEVEALSKQLGEAQKRFARVGSLQNSQGLLLANLCMWVLLVLAIPLVESGQMSGVYLAITWLRLSVCMRS